MLPLFLRDRLGSLLRGPPRGPRRQRNRCCLFSLGRVGDFVLTLSALRLLVQEWGPADCILVVPPALASLAGREFPGARCITLPMEAASFSRHVVPIWWRERRKFAHDRFEQLVCLSHQRSLYYELALSWIDADRDMRLMPGTYPALPAHGLCTELLAHWRLTENVLGRTVAREEILPRFTSLRETDDGRLLVCPFSRDASKNLSPDLIIGTLRLWRQRSRAPIILSGSPTDRPALERLAAQVRSAQLGRVGVETPAGLDRMLEHMAGAGAMFATDSAPAHIATALDKPCVVLVDRTIHGYCQPWSRSIRQQTFVNGTPAEQIAAALPAL